MKTVNIKLPLSVDKESRVPFAKAGHGYTVDNEDSNWVALCHHAEHAEFIANCCNSHDALVKALSDIMSATWRPEGMSECIADAARAALAKAGAV